MAGAAAGFAVKVDQWTKTMRLPTDDGHHEGKPEHAGASERGRGAALPDPDRKRILQRPRIDALPGQRGSMPAGPMHVFARANLQEQVELLRKERIIV